MMPEEEEEFNPDEEPVRSVPKEENFRVINFEGRDGKAIYCINLRTNWEIENDKRGTFISQQKVKFLEDNFNRMVQFGSEGK